MKHNVIYERTRFNRRGETAEQYIVALYSRAENCDYGAMKEELIRHRLVVGIRDATLSERLQLDAELTLEKVNKFVRQKEAIHEQQQVVREGDNRSNPIQLDAVRMLRQRHRQPRGSVQSREDTTRKLAKQCSRCGGGPHPREKCRPNTLYAIDAGR